MGWQAPAGQLEVGDEARRVLNSSCIPAATAHRLHTPGLPRPTASHDRI